MFYDGHWTGMREEDCCTMFKVDAPSEDIPFHSALVWQTLFEKRDPVVSSDRQIIFPDAAGLAAEV